MKTTVNFYDFTQAWDEYNHETSFTYEGKRALFEYLEQLEQDIGEEIELDIVALDCEFEEYADLDELKANYPDIETLGDLYDNTQVIEFDGGLIISEF